MSIHISSYDTVVGSSYKLDKIQFGIEKAIINNQIVIDENNENVYRLYSHELDDIPVFSHPLVIELNGENKVTLDLRQYTKLDRATGDYQFRLTNEAALQINRGLLNSVWIERDPYVLLNLSPIPMVVFAGWISENITRRFALDPKDQLAISIYAAYYYYCLFSDNDVFDDEDKNRIISSISRNLRCAAVDVMEIIDRIDVVIPNITVFCEKLETVTANIRLKNFNSVLLFQILGGSWFGSNARETIAVALEHPPTWIALILSSFTERTYRNTIIAKTAERKANKSTGDNFSRAVFNLIIKTY